MIRIAIPATDSEPAQVRSFSARAVVIGRGDRCDLVLRAAGVSASHCRLSLMDGVEGAYVLEDLGSTYGTYVNGTRVQRPVIVSSRDAITVGEHAMRIAGDGENPTRASPPGVPAVAATPTSGTTVAAGTWEEEWARFDALATAWHARGRPKNALLRSVSLREGEEWLRAGRNRRPAPGPLHRDLIAASRRAARRRSFAIGGSIGALAITALVGIAVFHRPTVEAIAELPLADESVTNAGESSPAEPAVAAPPSHDTSAIATLAERTLAIDDPEQRLMLQAEVAQMSAASPFFADPQWALQRSAHETLQSVRSTVLREHTAAVTAVAFDPRGRWIASGSRDHTAKLWDLHAPAPTIAITLYGHVGDVTALAISPDGHWLLTASEDRTVRRWDLEAEDPGATGVVLRGHDAPIVRLAFDPAGRWAASGDRSGALVVWAIDSEHPTDSAQRREAHEGPITDLVFDPAGGAMLLRGRRSDREALAHRRRRPGAHLDALRGLDQRHHPHRARQDRTLARDRIRRRHGAVCGTCTRARPRCSSSAGIRRA